MTDNPNSAGQDVTRDLVESDTVVRFSNPRLFEAIEEFAGRPEVQRSVNDAIVLLLEEAMMARSLWPPPSGT